VKIALDDGGGGGNCRKGKQNGTNDSRAADRREESGFITILLLDVGTHNQVY